MREVECGCIDQPINISNRLMLDAINVLCSELPEGIMLNLEQWYYVSFDAINLLCEDSCVILRHLEQTEWIAWSRNSPPWGAHYAFSEPSWHGLLKSNWIHLWVSLSPCMLTLKTLCLLGYQMFHLTILLPFSTVTNEASRSNCI